MSNDAQFVHLRGLCWLPRAGRFVSAEVARLCRVSRARVAQIMNLLFLAPDIQEETLFSTAEPEGGALVSLKRLRHVVAEAEWEKQRELLRALQ